MDTKKNVIQKPAVPSSDDWIATSVSICCVQRKNACSNQEPLSLTLELKNTHSSEETANQSSSVAHSNKNGKFILESLMSSPNNRNGISLKQGTKTVAAWPPVMIGYRFTIQSLSLDFVQRLSLLSLLAPLLDDLKIRSRHVTSRMY